MGRYEQSFKEESYRMREKQRKSSANKYLYVFMIVFVAGYFVFFTSKLWLPTAYVGVETTPVGKMRVFETREVTIDSWRYSESQRRMEIVVEITNQSLDGITDYDFAVRNRARQFETIEKCGQNGFYVVWVENVPKDWAEASLTIDLQRSDRGKHKGFTPIVIYTNDKIVKNTAVIKRKPLKDYQIAAIKDQISASHKEIEELIERLDLVDRKIKEAEKRAQEIESDMDYQTDSEKEESTESIQGLMEEKHNLEDRRKELVQEMDEHHSKIDLLKKQMSDIKKEKQAKPTNDESDGGYEK